VRRLLFIPMVHTNAEVLLPSGPVDTIANEFWRVTEHYFQISDLPLNSAKVYQDNLPDLDDDLVQRTVDNALPTSPNMNFVRWLKSQGAKIMGTENYELLVRQRDAMLAGNAREAYRIAAERDVQIAGRISSSLEEGELGILLLGMGHKIEDKTHLFDGIDLEVPSPIREFYELNRDREIGYDLSRYRRL